MAAIRVTSELAIVAVCDASVTLPSGTDPSALARELDAMAARAQVFYVVTDDPVTYRIELLMEGEAPQSGAQEVEPAGGSFGLEASSGSIAVVGWRADGTPAIAGTLTVPPGMHVLTAHTRRPFDGPRYTAHMTKLLGDEWTYMDRVNKLGAVGCLPLVIAAVSLVAQQWRFALYMVPLAAVTWLPSLVLRRMGRFREAERRTQAESDSWPNFVLTLAPSAQKVAGGFLRV